MPQKRIHDTESPAPPKVPIVLIILIFVMAVVLVFGSFIYLFQKDATGELQKQISSLQTKLEELQKPAAEAETPKNSYTNKDYGFSMVFFDNWGEVQSEEKEIEKGSAIYKVLRLTSKGDALRYIDISIVRMEDKNQASVADVESALAGENARYAFYWASSGDCAGEKGCEDKKYADIKKEAGDIVMSFETSEPSINAPVSFLSQVENWDLYKADANAFLGAGKCKDKEFNALLADVNENERKSLEINGLKFVFTPNDEKLTDKEFSVYRNDENAMCEAGGIAPLRAYADKLLWSGICGAGTAPAEGEPGYEDYQKCRDVEIEINNFFGVK